MVRLEFINKFIESIFKYFENSVTSLESLLHKNIDILFVLKITHRIVLVNISTGYFKPKNDNIFHINSKFHLLHHILIEKHITIK